MKFLENELLRLRALEPEDLDLLYKWENDTLFWSAGNTITPYSRFIIRQYLKSQNEDLYTSKQLRLMIELKQEQLTIGTLDMFDFDPYHGRAGIGILVAPDFQSKGYASQTINLFVEYAFEFLKLHQVYANIAGNNKISLDLFQKQGFEIAGNLHSWLNTSEGWQDNYILQKIRR